MKKDINANELVKLMTEKLISFFHVTPEEATNQDIYKALAMVCREIMSKDYYEFKTKTEEQEKKTVYYLCMEFLMGRSLKNNLYNMGLEDVAAEALRSFNVSPEKIFEQEPDAGLGNGGLGRLAACFLDGLASQAYPSMGYSLRYEYGIFNQKLVDGWQTELPDFWLPGGSVWLRPHPEKAVEVSFNGHLTEDWIDGIHLVKIENDTKVHAVPYDMIVTGASGKGMSRLRLWAADSKDFDMQLFNDGEFLRAVEQKAMAESITKVLYPGDNHTEGKSLRLNQQYFLVSATIQDIIKRHLRVYKTLTNLPDKVAIHLNDTHPVLAVPELMRIIMDECGYGWTEAWRIVTNTVAYTNHTVMSEALECWSEEMFRTKLPRIYQIVCEINKRWCAELRAAGTPEEKVAKMAIICDGWVRMANLAVVVSHKVNGVSALHSNILKETVFKDFYEYTPDKFTNVTNGIAHRRWLCQSNPGLSSLIAELIGDGFVTDATELKKLEEFSTDRGVLDKLAEIKRQNKVRMAEEIRRTSGVLVDPDSIFDVQVKRLHEYKRQLMNALNIMATYQMLRDNPSMDFAPRTYIFGAKAAPGYYFAKQIIQFIVDLANQINSDYRVNGKLKVVYLENYRVTVAEKLIPAAEISEQISLAGTEASGTSNMKFMINGAVTLGTLDGANVEICDAVGKDNIMLFGMTAPAVKEMRANGYRSLDFYSTKSVVRRAVDEIRTGRFSPVADNLIYSDPYMVLADFESYRRAQERSAELYVNRQKWNQMSLMNIANAGLFSADRSINDYARDIWGIMPLD
ncbi:MAG: glycogen/starch/alpha-glucan phosphorylase [Ruminococcaceae bacterium]|nr:glycogen/starch/alpha-glucan phosphorylase [Oscillospiraceae bacterium]